MAAVTGPRRLSHAISEGDGISLIASVRSRDAARDAEANGAEGLVVTVPEEGLRDATSLPILWRAGRSPQAAGAAGADAWVVVVGEVEDGEELEALHAEALSLGLEAVAEVRDEEELELALERLDPEILLLSGIAAGEDEEPVERVLDLLPDVPAGKLAIAETPARSRDEIVALERAGIDGVLVEGELVAALAGGEPPAV